MTDELTAEEFFETNLKMIVPKEVSNVIHEYCDENNKLMKEYGDKRAKEAIQADHEKIKDKIISWLVSNILTSDNIVDFHRYIIYCLGDDAE